LCKKQKGFMEKEEVKVKELNKENSKIYKYQ